MLLVPDDKTEDDYQGWAEQIGKPSELGVRLQVAISYSDRSGPHVVATGVVGVPRAPEDDLERQMLAQLVADLVESADAAVSKSIQLFIAQRGYRTRSNRNVRLSRYCYHRYDNNN